MKIQAITLAAVSASASAATRLPVEISATSDLGRSLLSQSRRLDQNEDEADMTWIAGYSLKFQGCRHAASFNLDADGDEDVKVQTSKLAHFRLCPANSCESWLGGGCSSNYGDYVVDLATFGKTYVEGQRRAEEYQCQMYMYENCDCTESDDKDDNFNREYCEYDCFAKSKKMTGCIDRNPYEEEEGGERERRFEPERYMECKEFEAPEFNDDDANQNGRKLEEEEEVQYYIGPYCSADGGSVYLGMYTDDTCTNFADSTNGKSTYKELTRGQALPYSSTSVITSDCVSCIEKEDPNRSAHSDDNGDGEEEGVQVSNQCMELYESSGKCESHINLSKSGMTTEPVTSACSYISGIKFTKTNGILEVKSSKTATAFIVLFAFAFIGLAGFVYKLQKQVTEAKKSPLLTKEDSQEDQALA